MQCNRDAQYFNCIAAAAAAVRHTDPSRLRRWLASFADGRRRKRRREEGFTDISTAAHYSAEQAACLLDQPRHPFTLTGLHGRLGSLCGVQVVWKRTVCAPSSRWRRGACPCTWSGEFAVCLRVADSRADWRRASLVGHAVCLKFTIA